MRQRLAKLYEAIVVAISSLAIAIAVLDSLGCMADPLASGDGTQWPPCAMLLAVMGCVPLVVRTIQTLELAAVGLAVWFMGSPFAIMPCLEAQRYHGTFMVLLTLINVTDFVIIIATLAMQAHRRLATVIGSSRHHSSRVVVVAAIVDQHRNHHATMLDDGDQEDPEDCVVCLEPTPSRLKRCGHPLCPECCDGIVARRRGAMVPCPVCRLEYAVVVNNN